MNINLIILNLHFSSTSDNCFSGPAHSLDLTALLRSVSQNSTELQIPQEQVADSLCNVLLTVHDMTFLLKWECPTLITWMSVILQVVPLDSRHCVELCDNHTVIIMPYFWFCFKLFCSHIEPSFQHNFSPVTVWCPACWHYITFWCHSIFLINMRTQGQGYHLLVVTVKFRKMPDLLACG